MKAMLSRLLRHIRRSGFSPLLQDTRSQSTGEFDYTSAFTFRQLSIRYKLVFLVAATTVSALVIMAVPLTIYQVKQYEKRVGEALEAQSRLIAAQSDAALAFFDGKAAQHILATLKAIPQVVSARIYLTDGRVFAEYVRQDEEPIDTPAGELAQGFEYREVFLQAASPVTVDGELLGTVLITAKPKGVDVMIRRQIYLVGSLLLLALFLTVLASRRLRRLVSEPLVELVSHMQRFSTTRDYTYRARVSGSDEIGKLSSAFNEMLEQIQRRDRELILDQEHLENEVALRTTELQKELEQRARNEDELRLAASVFESSAEGIFITDVHKRILRVNRAFTCITGYEAEEVIGTTPHIMQSGLGGREFYQAMWEGLMSRDHWEGEITSTRKNGDRLTEWLNISLVRDQSGDVSHYVGIFHDITEKKATEERIYRLAHYDELTGLANRRLFFERLDHALKLARRKQQSLVLMYLDLDQFKPVNDNLGHEAGDTLLKQFGSRLPGYFREMDTVARLGGDEFVVLLENVNSEQAGQIAEKLLREVGSPFEIQGQEIRIGASIGIAIYPHDGLDGESLLANSDIAMYSAKESGRNNYRYFAKEMNEATTVRFQLQAGLRRALDKDEFVQCYQPQFETASGKLLQVEALLRWQHPEKGFLGTEEFLEVAEESGLIIPMDQWSLNAACRQRAAWDGLVAQDFVIGVNLSTKQFHTGDIVRLVKNALASSGIQPHQLQLELTESTLMRDMDAAEKELRELYSLGVSIALDDFGTGCSSISYLKRLPFTALKVDRSFLKEVPEDPNDSAIVKAIIRMAHSLGAEVIAEGVETEEQLYFLLEQGCDLVQGYYYSSPLLGDEVARCFFGDAS